MERGGGGDDRIGTWCPEASIENSGITRSYPTSGEGCCKASLYVVGAVSPGTDGTNFGVCGNVCWQAVGDIDRSGSGGTRNRRKWQQKCTWWVCKGCVRGLAKFVHWLHVLIWTAHGTKGGIARNDSGSSLNGPTGS